MEARSRTAPHPALGRSRFLAFFDECGDHSLTRIDPDFPLFVLALVVVGRAAYEVARHKLYDGGAITGWRLFP